MIRDRKDLVNIRESKEVPGIRRAERMYLRTAIVKRNKHHIRPSVLGNERYRAISFRNNFGLGDRSPQIGEVVPSRALSPLEGRRARFSFRW